MRKFFNFLFESNLIYFLICALSFIFFRINEKRDFGDSFFLSIIFTMFFVIIFKFVDLVNSEKNIKAVREIKKEPLNENDLLEVLKKEFPNSEFRVIREKELEKIINKPKKDNFLNEYLESPQVKELFKMCNNILKDVGSGDTVSEDVQNKYYEDLENKNKEIEDLKKSNNDLLDIINVKNKKINCLELEISFLSAEILTSKNKS